MSQRSETQLDQISSDEKLAEEFAKESESRQPSILAEFFDFLVHNKKWWLTPIVLVLLFLSFFVLMTNTALGPFIYVLF